MNYITGKTIRKLRERRKLTQKELADLIHVSDKAVSKWETDKGLPDIAIIEDLATALGVSIQELLTGDYRENDNISANMKKLHFYVCPICGNVITSIGKGSFSCCGVSLPEQEIENNLPEQETENGTSDALILKSVNNSTEESTDKGHTIVVDTVEDEYLITMHHPMTKKHYISFIAYVVSDTVTIVKLYPEQDISVRFRKHGHGLFYAYCNRHGLFRIIK